MGIDARILLRLPYEPTEDQLRRWSWYVCETFGADKFMVANRLKQTDSDWNYQDDQPGVFERLTVYQQDGPDVVAPSDGALVLVRVYTRYYGVGYERGDLLFLCALAEWVEQNIQGCEVLYGGDSSGVCVAPWPAEERERLRCHLYSPDSGRAYFSGWESEIVRDDPRPDVSECKLCIPGKRPARYGSGASYAAYHCHGCGLYFKTQDGGASWAITRDGR